jgi:hypothetical protein
LKERKWGELGSWGGGGVNAIRGTRRLRLRKGDVLDLPIIVARIENENWRFDVLQRALREKALGGQSRGEGGNASGVQVSR